MPAIKGQEIAICVEDDRGNSSQSLTHDGRLSKKSKAPTTQKTTVAAKSLSSRRVNMREKLEELKGIRKIDVPLEPEINKYIWTKPSPREQAK